MRLRSPLPWPIVAFLYAAVVPFGSLFGPIYLARSLGGSLPGGEVGLAIGWATVVLVATTALSARAPADASTLLPAMAAGVAVGFGGVQVVVWRTQSVIAMLFGTVALVLVLVGCSIGTGRSRRRTRDDPVDGDVIRAGGIVVAMACATALVQGTVYWLQDAPGVYRPARFLLLSASPVVGFVSVWRGNLRLWAFLSLLAALPFVVVVADALTDPIALVFGLPAGGPLSLHEATIDLSTTVGVLVGIGAVAAGGTRHLGLADRVVALVRSE